MFSAALYRRHPVHQGGRRRTCPVDRANNGLQEREVLVRLCDRLRRAGLPGSARDALVGGLAAHIYRRPAVARNGRTLVQGRRGHHSFETGTIIQLMESTARTVPCS